VQSSHLLQHTYIAIENGAYLKTRQIYCVRIALLPGGIYSVCNKYKGKATFHLISSTLIVGTFSFPWLASHPSRL
jgi:hypothetical protein